MIYADPPYLIDTRTALQRRPGGDYVHEFVSVEQHRALAGALRGSSSTVILSGYHSALYDELYGDWFVTERTVVRRTSNMSSGGQPRTIEVLWSNRPLRADGALFELQRGTA